MRLASAKTKNDLLYVGNNFEDSIYNHYASNHKRPCGLTLVTADTPKGCEHSFSENELERQMGIPACRLMITHDLDAQESEFITIPVAHERVTLFSANGRNLNLDESDLAAILEGKITNWKTFGYENRKINIYRRKSPKHAPEVDPYAKRLGFALKRSGIDPSYFLNLTGFDSYEEQYLAARKDLGAFVVGLRGFEVSGLSKVKINGEAFSFDMDLNKYNLGYFVRFVVRNNEITRQNLDDDFQRWFKKVNLDYKKDLRYLS